LDEDMNKARLSHESALKNWENSYKKVDYDLKNVQQQSESRINKLTDEVRFKDSEL